MSFNYVSFIFVTVRCIYALRFVLFGVWLLLYRALCSFVLWAFVARPTGLFFIVVKAGRPFFVIPFSFSFFTGSTDGLFLVTSNERLFFWFDHNTDHFSFVRCPVLFNCFLESIQLFL